MKLLFLRPPRHSWPILNESDNFLLPLAYPTLAGYLRQKMKSLDIIILDTCARRIGWNSLRQYLTELQPDIVAIGEKTTYYREGLRAFELAREVNPEVVTIAGGPFYTALPQWTLGQCRALDFVVLFEGEQTLHKLLETIASGGDPSRVHGLAYRDNAGVPQLSPARKLIDNLDDLPFPAYDLAGLEYYQPFGKLWPRAATIQRSRGCIANCTFCSWRIQEGQPELKDDRYVSHQAYRTKSARRTFEEVELLYRRHGIRYLFWVDGTWNLDSEWLSEFCGRILSAGIKLDGWWAFVRADRLIEQHRDKILKKMVAAGFRHALVGAERANSQSLNQVKKGIDSSEVTVEAFRILSEHYPKVFRQATYLTGMPDDTVEDIKNLLAHAHRCNLDFAAFHPLTPFPGTPMFEEARQLGLLEETDYTKYDMFYPVMRTHHISRAEVAAATDWCYKNFVLKRPLKYLGRLFSPNKTRRSLHRWFAISIARVVLLNTWQGLLGRQEMKGFSSIHSLWKPNWYDS